MMKEMMFNMKRELKFRFWDVRNKKFIDEDPLYSKWAVTLDGEPYNGKYDHRYDEDEYIVQQYTGLKDKNGKEIYEGDILLCTFHNSTRNQKGIVEYFASSFIVNWMDQTDDSLDEVCADFEVIGNIFDNPELLK
ncbi:Conserved hypothetical protein CHP1671 [uncultured Caudovirales phage]|uniref:YopX protein domain-containing protein n=1 Tax=uncultured Caudovirales phage TaxID=2100421 RepID=A0A6J7XBH2_9CAUD|nr:Conserved hypothetical protein CHP1671 [uncultured Caudovirales phage]